MNWSFGSPSARAGGAEGPKSPPATQWPGEFGGRCCRPSVNPVWLEGGATRCCTSMAVLLRVSTATLKRRRACLMLLWCFSSQPDSLKGREEKGDAKAAGLSVISAWHGISMAEMRLELLPAPVTPMVSFKCTVLHACLSGFPQWVQSWAAVAGRASCGATSQGTAWFAYWVGIPVADRDSFLV